MPKLFPNASLLRLHPKDSKARHSLQNFAFDCKDRVGKQSFLKIANCGQLAPRSGDQACRGHSTKPGFFCGCS